MNEKTIPLESVKHWIEQNKPISWIAKQVNVSISCFKRNFPNYNGNQGQRPDLYKKNSVEEIEKDILNNSITQYAEPVIRSKIKKYLLHKNGHKCSVCNYTTWNNLPIPLTCDHIDGNSLNCSVENFRLICANCDRQQITFGSKNKGNGRIAARKYWCKNKQFYNKNADIV